MNNSDEQMTHNGGDVTQELRLGVNIDHVATVRNARGEFYPSPLRAAVLAESCGADSVTIHLREDRRHINDTDLNKIKSKLGNNNV